MKTLFSLRRSLLRQMPDPGQISLRTDAGENLAGFRIQGQQDHQNGRRSRCVQTTVVLNAKQYIIKFLKSTVFLEAKNYVISKIRKTTVFLKAK